MLRKLTMHETASSPFAACGLKAWQSLQRFCKISLCWSSVSGALPHSARTPKAVIARPTCVTQGVHIMRACRWQPETVVMMLLPHQHATACHCLCRRVKGCPSHLPLRASHQHHPLPLALVAGACMRFGLLLRTLQLPADCSVRHLRSWSLAPFHGKKRWVQLPFCTQAQGKL